MKPEPPSRATVDLQDQIHRLSARVAELERNLASAQRSGFLARMQSKLRPNLWTFVQYPPRALTQENTRARLKVGPGGGALPSIAIVTPSFNQGGFIDFTIRSVLSQEYPALSYWVQDGASTDDTLDILRQHEPGLRWRSVADGGQTQAINLGFAQVTAEIMAYLNSDDILLPGALDYVGAFFRDNPTVDFVYSHRIFVDRSGLEVGRAILPRHDPVALKWADYLPQETMFWRRRVWDAVGPFDESFHYAMDWDFILRAQARGFKFHRLPTFLAAFRVHDLQKTTSIREVGEDEQMRLRQIHLGSLPSYRDINRAIGPYLRRHIVHTRLYKLKILNY